MPFCEMMFESRNRGRFLATSDEILWPTLSRWNCQTCLTHFYDSTRYFLVPTKKAVSLKSLHRQLVACCISIFHHENTHPDTLSINIYPDDPRCSMFAYICLHLSARQPPKCMGKIDLTLLCIFEIYFFPVVFISSAPPPPSPLEGNAEVVDALRDGAPPASSFRERRKRRGPWHARLAEDELRWFAQNRRMSSSLLRGNFYLRFRKSLKTPGEFWKSEFLKYKDVRRKEMIYGILNFWE